jgi:hypothetical protein
VSGIQLGGSPRSRGLGLAGWGFAASAVAFSAITFWGLGPKFEKRSWFDPSGRLASWLGETDLSPIAEELSPALWTFGLAAVALAVAVFFVTRAALPRFLAVAAVIATLCFVYYGIEASFVWRFFRWRWSASMALFAAVVGAVATAPVLARSWLRLGWAARLASYLPLFALVLVCERNVTGTDQTLSFAISPWPVVQIFGLELLGTCIGALVLGVGLGLFASLRARQGSSPALHVVGAIAAVALPLLALLAASAQELLPARPDARLLGLVGTASLVGFLLAATLRVGRQGEKLGPRARAWSVGGLLVLAPVLCAQLWARGDYTVTREERAGVVIDALAAYWEREESYPDKLTELVAGGDLTEIPAPRVGFGAFSDQEFVYQNFGDSYLLEFSAPRWIQCAYNPPYPDEEEEEEEADGDGEGLGSGSWSCPSKPPELW